MKSYEKPRPIIKCSLEFQEKYVLNFNITSQKHPYNDKSLIVTSYTKILLLNE